MDPVIKLVQNSLDAVLQDVQARIKEVQNAVLIRFTDECAMQGKTVHIANSPLPAQDMHSALTRQRDFDVALLRSNIQDLTVWLRGAVRSIVEELPNHATVAPPDLQLSKTAFSLNAVLTLHVVRPEEQRNAATPENLQDSLNKLCLEFADALVLIMSNIPDDEICAETGLPAADCQFIARTRDRAKSLLRLLS